MDFKSFCPQQEIPEKTTPKEESKINITINSTLEKKLEIKKNPNPPNFKTTLANTIDPKTGAST